MRELRSDRTLPTFVTLLVVALLLITFDIRTQSGDVVTAVRSGTSTLVTPLQRGALSVVNPLVDFVEGLADIASLRAENQALRARLAEAQAQLSSVQDELERKEVLERLLDVELVDPELARTHANVIGSTGSFDLSFRIDKGTRAGVLAGHPVLDENGYLVGRVLQAAPNSAIVVPITGDVEAVTVLAGNQVGTLSARIGAEELDLQMYDTTDPVAEGAQVVTASVSVSFPPGIPVGEVVETADPEGRALRATVRPYADLQRLRVVIVIAWPPDPTVGEPERTTPTTLPADSPPEEGAAEGGDPGSVVGGDDG